MVRALQPLLRLFNGTGMIMMFSWCLGLGLACSYSASTLVCTGAASQPSTAQLSTAQHSTVSEIWL